MAVNPFTRCGHRADPCIDGLVAGVSAFAVLIGVLALFAQIVG
ncbi:hypothetical protein [Oceaniradius stylonematis]|nr:hypothetical protein [Oceaniradius stylonematis]